MDAIKLDADWLSFSEHGQHASGSKRIIFWQFDRVTLVTGFEFEKISLNGILTSIMVGSEEQLIHWLSVCYFPRTLSNLTLPPIKIGERLNVTAIDFNGKIRPTGYQRL